MKSRYIKSFLFLICLIGLTYTNQLKASHIYGAEFSYTCVDPSTDAYFVMLKIYRDCAAIALPATANVTISSSSCAVTMNESLPKINSHESSPYCLLELANTNCNGGSLPGFEAGYYGKVVTLSGTCSDWLMEHNQCCRNSAITNLVNPGLGSLYVKSELDATAATCNSSPQWKQPAVIFCGTGMVNLELGADDPDGDSVVYTLVTPMDQFGVPLSYQVGFSATSPVSSSTAITFDNATGNMTFTPSTSQSSVIAVRADEYRNGTHIASSYRDIMITLATGATCTNANNPPLTNGGPSNVVNGTIGSNGVIEACVGSNLSFGLSIVAGTPAGGVTVSSNAADLGGIFGSTFLGYSFSWTPVSADTGIHVLTLVARGDCVNSGLSVFNYVINVASCVVSGPVDAGSDQSICLGSSVQLQATGGVDYVWSPATGLSDPNIANPVASPVVTTVYYVSSFNGGMLLSTDSVTVTVEDLMVDINILSGSVDLCPDDSIILDAAVTGAGFAGYQWSTGETTSSITLSNFNPITFTPFVSITVTDNIGCTGSDTLALNLQDDCVWPGDADYDGVANNFDILNIGLGFGTTGSTRAGASINWEAQFSDDWVDTFSTGINYKHADCNGDGTIDNTDTVAVSQNYGLTHAKGNAANGNGLLDPALYFTFSNDSVNAGDTLLIYANLGRDTLPAVDVYGIAFTVNYDAALVDTGSASTDFSNSWIDIPVDGLMSFTKKFNNTGMIDIAITRTDQVNANTNFGPIGSISVVMKDDISGKDQISKAFELSFSKVLAVSANGTELSIFREDGTATVSQELVGISDPEFYNSMLNVFPNPASGSFHIHSKELDIESIEVFNLLGESVLTMDHRNGESLLIDHNLDQGMYLIQVNTAKGIVTKKITIVD